MLKEALELIGKQAVKAASPAPIRVQGDDYRAFVPEGFTEIDLPVPFRAHTAADLTAIIDFAKSYEKASVFYSRHFITCLVDDTDRRDKIGLELELSPQLKTIMEWEKTGRAGALLGQKELILLLRTMFKRCLGRAPNLVETLRRLKFESGGTVVSEVGKNKASLTKDMLARVSGESELPDEFDLVVPVFDGILQQIEAQITVALEANGDTGKFTLIPIPGDVETALCAAERVIGDQLTEALDNEPAGERLYYGQA